MQGIRLEGDVDLLHLGVLSLSAPEPGLADEEVGQTRPPARRIVHEEVAARAGAGEHALGHPGGERGGDAGVNGRAALGQDSSSCLSGQGMTGRDRAAHAESLVVRGGQRALREAG